MAQEDHLAQLITDMKDSLEREIHAVQQAIAQLSEKLDRQDTRLSRQGGIIQGGARQITRMVDWTEAADDQATKSGWKANRRI